MSSITRTHVPGARLAASIAAAAAALVAWAPLAAAGPISLRIATLAPPGSTWMKKLDKGSQAISQKTGGRVEEKWYPGGVQGDERDFVRKMKLGQLDGAAVTSVGLSMIDPSIRVLELPGMFRSIDELDYVADKMWPRFQKKFKSEGYILADRGEVGWFYFLSKNKIQTIDDLKHAKVWLWGDDTMVKALYKQLGVSGIPLGAPEVDSALTANRISVCYGSPLAAVALQWSSKLRYRTELAMTYGIGATVMTKASYDKLTPADQRMVLKLMQKTGREIRKAVRQDNDDADKQMKRQGVQVVPTPPATRAAFEKAAEAVWHDLAGKMYPQSELDLVLKYRDEYRKKHP